MAVSVKELMIKPFSSRTTEEQVKIIKHGKPRPIEEEHIFVKSETFPLSMLYDQEEWLTACEELYSIICWACLLFPSKETGNRCFITTIKDKKLFKWVLSHEKTIFHKTSLCEYAVFKKEHPLLDNDQSVQTLEPKKNILKHELIQIVDIACLLAANASVCLKDSRYRDSKQSAFNLYNIESYVKIMMRLKNSKTSEDVIDNVRKCPMMIPKTIEAIAEIMKINLQNELQLCSYVSLILSKHSRNSKLSLVVRFVNNGSVYERFLCIFDTMDINLISRDILKIIEEYEMSSKLLSVSCDGAIPNESNLVVELQEKYSCMHIFCHFHDINFILEQRLSRLKNCEMFFIVVNSMKNFFQDNSRLCKILKDFSKTKIPDLYNLKFNIAQFLRILKLYRCQFQAFFCHITKNLKTINKNEFSLAIAFESYLGEYETVFMIEAFNRLFNYVAVVGDLLNSGSPEKVFDVNVLDSVEVALINEKSNGFENLWTTVLNELLKDDNPESFQAVERDETDVLSKLYLEAIDCIINEINFRFKSIHNFEFLSVLNCVAHNKLLASDYQIKQIQEMNGDFINKEEVITEMKILNKSDDLFCGKSVQELLDVLTEKNLKDTFSNIYQFGELILTLPFKTNSNSKCPSKIDIINNFDFESNKPEMKYLSLLIIENDYLEYLKSQTNFYENVLEKLQEKLIMC